MTSGQERALRSGYVGKSMRPRCHCMRRAGLPGGRRNQGELSMTVGASSGLWTGGWAQDPNCDFCRLWQVQQTERRTMVVVPFLSGPQVHPDAPPQSHSECCVRYLGILLLSITSVGNSPAARSASKRRRYSLLGLFLQSQRGSFAVSFSRSRAWITQP